MVKPKKNLEIISVLPIDGPMPNKSRNIRDLWCIILLILVIILFLFIAIYAGVKGSTKNAVSVYDIDGNACGKGALKSYPYLYFTKDFKSWTKIGESVCVSKCPTSSTDTNFLCKTNSKITSCSQIVPVKTVQVIHKFCMKETGHGTSQAVNVKAVNMGDSIYEAVMGDVMSAWWVFLIIYIVALLLSCLYVYLMKFCNKIIFYISMVFYIGGSVGMGFYFWYLYKGDKGNTFMSWFFDTEDKFKGMAIGFWVGAVVLTLLCLASIKHLESSLEALKAGIEFIHDVSGVLWHAIGLAVILVTFQFFWVWIALQLVSLQKAKYVKGHAIGQYKVDGTSTQLLSGWTFCLWFFIIFLNQLRKYITGVSVMYWYFNREKALTTNSVCKSYKLLCKYYFGTQLYGTFVATVVYFLSYPLFFLYKHTYREDSKDKSCCTTCLKWFNRSIRCALSVINDNAYIEQALHGYKYCTSLDLAFSLNRKNSCTLLNQSAVVNMISFIGSYGITMLCALLSWGQMSISEKFKKELFSYTFLNLQIIGLTFLISIVVLNVIVNAADAILHCYLIDAKSHNGLAKFTNNGMHELLTKTMDNPHIELVDKSFEYGKEDDRSWDGY